MDYSTRNITFSKDGATLTCPICGDSDTYQIGELDKDKWTTGRHNKYYCQVCIIMKMPTPNFFKQEYHEPEEDIDKLMDMI